ncbi:MAG: HAD family hydrolase [Paracoccaceae bacterium]|nr:HAD family hydrolase [Paracoccaceae bacterium]
MVLTTICFDADDTLWHNERFFRLTEARFVELLCDHADPDHLAERLLDAERRNIEHYGYGVKGFTLSMIETALQVTENRVPGAVIAEIVSAGQEMLAHPIELLPGAEQAVTALSEDFQILLITKGDLIHQERKLAQSGLGERFDGVEIVSEKHAAVYRDIFSGRSIAPEAAVMVGNSLKSDVNPAIEAGGWGVHVPFELAWALEHAEAPRAHPRFREIGELSALPALVEEICRNI